jgi:hypothetical protein
MKVNSAKRLSAGHWLIRSLRDFYAYWRLFTGRGAGKDYWVGPVAADDTPTLLQAKRLHAAIYLSIGFIDHTDIRDGIMHAKSDPHQLHADYFIVKHHEEVVAVARQIVYKGVGPHHESFPSLKKTDIYARSQRAIEKIPATSIVEISALVKKRGESPVVPLILYREMWRHSLQQHHKLWVMACDVRLYERLRVLFGPAMRVMGKKTYYMGSDTIPAMLEPHAGLRYLMKRARTIIPIKREVRRHILMFFVQDSPPEAFYALDKRQLVKMNILINSTDTIGKWGWAWVAVVVAYSIARSLFVGVTLTQYGVDPFVFLAIDLATAVVFAYAQVRSLRYLLAHNFGHAALWLLVVLFGFAAPYVYLLSYGGVLPSFVNILIILWCTVFGAIATAAFMAKIRKSQYISSVR